MSEIVDCRGDDDQPSEDVVDRLVAAVTAGDLVVLPVDARYGVACDAFRPEAVARMRRARGSGRHVPPPVLVPAHLTLHGLTPQVTPVMSRLTEAFWPGGLTIVVPEAQSLAWDLGDTQGTVAVRMPRQALALAVLRRTGPLAVTGAHRVGWPPPDDVAQAREQLGDAVAVYAEMGRLAGGGDAGSGPGAASTVVDLTGPRPRLLRPGVVSLDDLAQYVPDIVV